MICPTVGGERKFSGTVTARQMCDIPIVLCHGGLFLKVRVLSFSFPLLVDFPIVGECFVIPCSSVLCCYMPDGHFI